MKLWRYGQEIENLGKRYQLIGSLGSGGMADVCLATDEREKREVAIKIIKPDKLDQTTLDRFLKEITQVQKLKHPHILTMYSGLNLELLDGARGSIVPYIVMEYARGGDLHSRLTRGQPYPFDKTLRVFSQLCSAVHYAHEQGIIHRDLKPHNILIRQLPDDSEQIVLGDFGMAVEIDATHHTYADGGTPLYMAPEQFLGHAEAASDIFALGVILYQLTTGQFPFRYVSPYHQAFSKDIPIAPSTLNSKLPKTLDSVILTALAKVPSQRFSSAALFEKNVRLAVTPSRVSASLPRSMNHAQPSSFMRTEKASVPKELARPNTRPVYAAPSRIRETNVPGTKNAMSVSKSKQQGGKLANRYTKARATGSVPYKVVSVRAVKSMHPVLFISLVVILVLSAATLSCIFLKAPNTLGLVKNVIPISVRHTSATAATGTITFYNSLPNAVTIGVTVFTLPSGVKFENNGNVVVPAAYAPSEGFITVNAHAITLGSRGNIAAKAYDALCCTSGITAISGAFTGGRDAQSYTFVQQGT